MKVLAAMSGGVDSAVAAARAVDAGHEVVGVHLALSRVPGTLRTGSRGCCTLEDSNDAWRACEKLGIPYYVWDFSERFQAEVVDDFIAEYAAGRTPNPCVSCNERIKFSALLERALALGFEAVCTGHYARIEQDAQGNRELHRSQEWAKDQSYVLGVLTHEQLQHALFPLDDVVAKADVRREAERRGLSVAKKPDSYDICFIPDGDTAAWLADKMPMERGDIVDETGEKLGEHSGANAFTVGQRRGLRLGTPAADGKPRFVLEVRPREKTVVVGPQRLLEVNEVWGDQISWAGLPLPEVLEARPFTCQVQVRAHADAVSATARVIDGRIVASLNEPLRAVAPGQRMVLYRGTRVLGQATIGVQPAERLAALPAGHGSGLDVEAR